MNEISETIKVFKDLGVIQIFTIPLSFLIFVWLFKRLILNGSGETITKIGIFLKGIILEYMGSEKDRVKSQISIDHNLADLVQQLHETAEGLGVRISYLETTMREHIAETHNLILLFKRKQEQSVQDNLALVDTQYFKTEGKPS